MRQSRILSFVMAWAAVGYLLLGWAVASGLTVPVDDAVYELFRPGGSWGRAQEFFGDVVDGGQPVVALVALVVVALTVAVRRRSLQPVLVAALLTVPTALVVVATKWLVDRADPAGGFVPHDGSYPSGHVALVLVCGAGVALVLRRPVPGSWWLVVGALWVVMSLAVLVVGLHWASDVLGGTLVAVVVVAGTLLSLGHRAPATGPGPDETAVASPEPTSRQR